MSYIWYAVYLIIWGFIVKFFYFLLSPSLNVGLYLEASSASPLYSRFGLNWTFCVADISDYFLDFVCLCSFNVFFKFLFFLNISHPPFFLEENRGHSEVASIYPFGGRGCEVVVVIVVVVAAAAVDSYICAYQWSIRGHVKMKIGPMFGM